MTSAAQEVTAPFTMLVVCTGNICRSPLVEQLLRARLVAAGIQINVQSAGTRAMLGGEMTPEAAALSLHYGGVPMGHHPQQLTAQLVAHADVVLTANREHRSEVVSLHPRAARYAFTLNQFARLVAAFGSNVPPVSLRAFVAELAATRGLTPQPERPGGGDIDDPYRQPIEVYDRVGREIDAAVAMIARGLATAIGGV